MHAGFLWLAGFRDLQWRRRRFVIAVLGTSLVFGLTLLLSGFLSTFDTEVARTIKLFRADGYVVPEGRLGPFTGGAPMPVTTADEVAKLRGIAAADPVVSILQVTDQDYRPDVYLIGARLGGLGTPQPAEGRVAKAPGEAVVDNRTTMHIGDEFAINGVKFNVVGLTHGVTVVGGHGTVFTLIEDAQRVVFGGQPFATSIAVKGHPDVVPAGISFVGAKRAGADLKRPLDDTIKSIGLFRALLWIVAAAIVGSVVYLSAIERVGDFAVFKATGVATRDLLGALVTQAIVLSIGASILSIGVAYLLAPAFPVTVLIPAKLQLTVPVVGLVIGVLASGAALRRAVTVDPALAFGGR
ncbi:MAG: ABC transporter permease [Actinobacteria bacterium]|nr:ABC transporter permease [Actinomycetota bacterium]